MVSDAQHRSILDRLRAESDRHFLICGLGGSGKSELVREYLGEVREPSHVAVTSMTRGSALANGGITLYALLGVREIDERGSFDRVLQSLLENPVLVGRIAQLTTLVIDDVNRLSCHVFDLLDHMFRQIRKGRAPFGGARLILLGDFLSLPPVVDFRGRSPQGVYVKIGESFCFRSDLWPQLRFEAVYLRESHRADKELGSIVKELAEGVQTDATAAALRSRQRILTGSFESFFGTMEESTGKMVVCAGRDRAVEINEFMVGKNAKVYSAVTVPALPPCSPEESREQEAKFGFPTSLSIKVGSRVRMLTTSIVLASKISKFQGPSHPKQDIRVKRGALGVVISFANANLVEKKKGHMGLIGRFPSVNLAVEVKLDNGFHFFVGLDSEEVAKGTDSWTRTQIPLDVAFASTAHSASGYGLSGVLIAMSEKSMLPGQFVTAVSRSRSLEDIVIDAELEISTLDVAPHEEVKSFYSASFPTENFAWTCLDGKKCPITLGSKRTIDSLE